MRSSQNKSTLKIGTIFFPQVGGEGGRRCQVSNQIYVWMGRDGGGAAGTG